jgi:hypothetical protein
MLWVQQVTVPDYLAGNGLVYQTSDHRCRPGGQLIPGIIDGAAARAQQQRGREYHSFLHCYQVLRELQPVLKTLNTKSNALVFEAKPGQDPQPKRQSCCYC